MFSIAKCDDTALLLDSCFQNRNHSYVSVFVNVARMNERPLLGNFSITLPKIVKNLRKLMVSQNGVIEIMTHFNILLIASFNPGCQLFKFS